MAAAVLGVLAGLQLSAPFLERTLVEVMEVIYSYNIYDWKLASALPKDSG